MASVPKISWILEAAPQMVPEGQSSSRGLISVDVALGLVLLSSKEKMAVLFLQYVLISLLESTVWK